VERDLEVAQRRVVRVGRIGGEAEFALRTDDDRRQLAIRRCPQRAVLVLERLVVERVRDVRDPERRTHRAEQRRSGRASANGAMFTPAFAPSIEVETTAAARSAAVNPDAGSTAGVSTAMLRNCALLFTISDFLASGSGFHGP
jgi:hypothetical protein